MMIEIPSRFSRNSPRAMCFLRRQVFPTAARATCHGISAASGKVLMGVVLASRGVVKQRLLRSVLASLCPVALSSSADCHTSSQVGAAVGAAALKAVLEAWGASAVMAGCAGVAAVGLVWTIWLVRSNS